MSNDNVVLLRDAEFEKLKNKVATGYSVKDRDLENLSNSQLMEILRIDARRNVGAKMAEKNTKKIKNN